MATGRRNTTTRDRHRRIIARDQPPCHICGDPIDYNAGHLDPLSFQIDHITPIARGGEDTLDNLAASHRGCNRDKGDRDNYTPGVTFTTERSWT
ncbi:HNH endonuclease [Rhodococcus hoagii]|nr:HNH endonuclease [Prescottella equi]